MARVVKFAMTEAGPFKPNGNRNVQISIPSETACDMTQSYLIFYFTLNQNGVAHTQSAFMGNALTKFSIGSIVRNAELYSSNYGLLEQNKHVNILRQNLNQYEYSGSEERSMEKYGYGMIEPVDDNGNFICFCPMKDILGCGYQSQFNLERLGDLVLRLELEPTFKCFSYAQDPALLTYGGSFNIDSAQDTGANAKDGFTSVATELVQNDNTLIRLLRNVGEVQVTYTNAVDPADEVSKVYDFSDVTFSRTAGGEIQGVFATPVTGLTDAANYDGVIKIVYNDNGLHSGLDCETNADGDLTIVGLQPSNVALNTDYLVMYQDENPAGTFTLKSVIKQFTDRVQDNLTGKTTLILNSDLPADGTISNVFVVITDIARNNGNLDYEVQKIEFSMFQRLQTPLNKNTPQEFRTYHLEQVNVPATNNFRKLLDIEENTCDINILTTPFQDLALPSFVSTTDNVVSMRNMLDNVLLQNRDVEIPSALYNDLLLENLYNVKNLKNRLGTPDYDPFNNNSRQFDPLFVVPHTFDDEESKRRAHTFQINLNAEDGTTFTEKLMYVFKTIERKV